MSTTFPWTFVSPKMNPGNLAGSERGQSGAVNTAASLTTTIDGPRSPWLPRQITLTGLGAST